MSMKSRTLSNNMEDTKDRHRRYQRAIQPPIRRDILRAMGKGATSKEELEKETGVDAKTLDWHLKTLEHGFCIEKEGESDSLLFVLTQEGRIVEYLDKKEKSSKLSSLK
jgi:predicted transcriptional regulator